jgi:hypothetical protein
LTEEAKKLKMELSSMPDSYVVSEIQSKIVSEEEKSDKIAKKLLSKDKI